MPRGRCIWQNSTKEANLACDFPVCCTDTHVEAVCRECVGARIPPGDFEVTFNGIAHSMTDSRLFCDLSIPDSGFVPYSGQKASDYCIAQWRQNEKQTTTVLCEYDPNR